MNAMLHVSLSGVSITIKENEMSSTNLVVLKGNLGREPELIEFGEKKKAVFSIAVTQMGMDKPLWVEISVWGKQAAACAQNLIKGSEVVVNGRLCMDSWTSKDGDARRKWYVTAFNVDFCGRPRSKSEVIELHQTLNDDDIPF
tara:strand:+ start:470 stop:898 length:429 start_codon:yes stop_codon:yes gene_type:complete